MYEIMKFFGMEMHPPWYDVEQPLESINIFSIVIQPVILLVCCFENDGEQTGSDGNKKYNRTIKRIT